jgi:hypothetical protein
MSTTDAQTALYAEDRGLQVPMTLEHGPVTSSGKAAPGPDPRIRHRIQIGMFRPIRVVHTNCLQVAIKTHSFILEPQRALKLVTVNLHSYHVNRDSSSHLVYLPAQHYLSFHFSQSLAMNT